MNIVRQSPLINLLLLAAIVAVAFLCADDAAAHGQNWTAAAGSQTSRTAFLGAMLDALQADAPRAARWCSAIIYFIAGWVVGQVVRVRDLYPVRTTLSIPLYGLTACAVVLPGSTLAAAAASLVFAAAVRGCFEVCRDGYAFSPVFFAAFCAGLLPMIYAPALPLAVVVPLALLVFKRPAREAIVALAGLMLPVAAVSYVWWGAGHDFMQPLGDTAAAFAAAGGNHVTAAVAMTKLPLAGCLLAMAVVAALFNLANLYSVGSRPRYITIFNVCVLAVTLPLAALPSATEGVAGLVAVPAAIAVPGMLGRLRTAVADGLCLLPAAVWTVCVILT